MKKLLLLLAVTLAFTFTALAQTDTSGGASGQTATTTKTKKSKKTAGSDQSGAAAEHEHHGKAKKEASLTGCISAQPDAKGNYTLSNGRHKKGVELTPADKVKDHAGHQVQLKGEWKAAAAAGEETKGGGTKAAAKSFEVASVNHLADTCSQAAGGGTTAPTKKGAKDTKKGKDKGANPPGL